MEAATDKLGQKVAVVTGAARGIGWAIVDRLLNDGWSVTASDLPDLLPEAARRHQHDRLAWLAADVTIEEHVSQLINRAVGDAGRLDALVNNAAVTDVHRDWNAVTQDQWDRVMDVNLGGTFRCCRLAHPWLRRSPAGRIVNIGSITFAVGQRRLVDYVASKGGVVGLSRVLARELGEDGITVNTVSPGAIRTEAERQMFPDSEAVSADALAVQSIPRRGEAADVAALVAFLLREEAGFISGQDIHVDGGWMLS